MNGVPPETGTRSFLHISGPQAALVSLEDQRARRRNEGAALKGRGTIRQGANLRAAERLRNACV